MQLYEKDVKRLRSEMDFLKTVVKSRKTLIFGDNDAVGRDLERKFDFTSVCGQHALLEISFDQTAVSGDVTILVNGLLLSAFTPVIGHNEKDLDCELLSGDNTVEIVYEEYFDIENFKLKISGFVDLKNRGSRLTAMSFSGCYLACLYNGANKSYFIYRIDSGGRSELTNAQDEVCCASKLNNNSYVFVYGDGAQMYAAKFDDEGVLISSVVRFSANASAFFAGQNSNGALFYAIEGGRIKKYLFDGSLNLTVTDTGISGREVYDSGSLGLCVVGFDGKVRLFTETGGGQSVKDLGYISCPHLYTSGNNTYLCYSKDGAIYRQNLGSGAKTKLCYGGEYLPVDGETFLLRTGQDFVPTVEIQ